MFDVSINPSGGFGEHPGDKKAQLDHTYYGVTALEFFGEKPRYPDALERYVNQFYSSEGYLIDENGTPSIEATYYGMSVKRILGFKISSKLRILKWIIDTCFEGQMEGVVSTPLGCVKSVELLYLEDELDEDIRIEAAKNVVGRRYSDILGVGYTDKKVNGSLPSGENPRVSFIAEFLTVTDMLSISTDDSLRSEIEEFLISCQNRDGGFGDVPGDKSRINFTYQALKGLNILEADYNIQGVKKWLKSQENKSEKTGIFSNALWESWMVLNSMEMVGIRPKDEEEVINWLKDCQIP